MWEPEPYSLIGAVVAAQQITVTDWATAITIILTALAVILTALAIMVGVVAILGYGSLKEAAQKAAKEEAASTAATTAREVATQIANDTVREIWAGAQSSALVEGQAESLEEEPKESKTQRTPKTPVKTDKGLRKDEVK
jgi:predicted membrane protein